MLATNSPLMACDAFCASLMLNESPPLDMHAPSRTSQTNKNDINFSCKDKDASMDELRTHPI
jgi:hypothetical protein